MVALHPVPLDHGPPDASIPDTDLVIALADDAVLDRAGADALVEYAATEPADAWFGDVTHGSLTRLRTAWSPTRATEDPHAFAPFAVRAGWLRTQGIAADAPDVAQRLAQTEADVVHLTTTLTRHPSPPATNVRSRPPSGRPSTDIPAAAIPATVTVVIPTAGARLPDGAVAVERLLARLGALPERIESVFVVGDEFHADPAVLEGPGRRVVRRPPGPFNFSSAVNLGVLHARSPIVLLLNDDTEPEGFAFIDRMAARLDDPRTAAVGALLTYPDGTVQHAGIVIDDARPLHPFVGWQPAATEPHGGLVARDVIAVTGACLMVRRRDFLAVGGMSPSFPLSFNDIDLCIRLRRAVGNVVIEPAATLVHHETLTRAPVIAPDEWDRWIGRWGEIVDPWYHPAHHRPDDPHALARNADHLPPATDDPAVPVTTRRPVLRSRVHHARLAAADD